MSRLTDLIREAKKLDAKLGDALDDEVRHLQQRRAFGLNFERHTPEAVDLYGRPVRAGDKVRMLPPRGQTTGVDKRLWIVTGGGTVDGVKCVDLRDPKTGDVATYPLDDLVVVAEHTDVIYPGLVSTGKVERGGDKPFHTVINGENLHVLKALLYTHTGKIDCIYIDPPYNTGAKDWKYNNNYVEADDLYRHSKWLAFMERRLKIAKELLNPTASVLMATIDEKEYLRFGMLLEQVFPGARLQMVSSMINATGAIRFNEFTRVNEFIFFVMIGSIGIQPETQNVKETEPVRWNSLRRFEMSSRRNGPQPRPDQFYPVFVNRQTGLIEEIGVSLPPDVLRSTVRDRLGCQTLWPLKPDGTEMIWGLTPASLKHRLSQGYVRVTQARPGEFSLYYLTSGKLEDIARGEITVTGTAEDGSVIVERVGGLKSTMPATQWGRESHNAQTFGTKLLSRLVPNRRFPFPKSLYAVEDCLRFFVAANKEATVLDFFAGSGTSAHAVMRLNRQDGGRRLCISITNNEVASEEVSALRTKRLRPGDPDWEVWGICDHVTKPRIEAAIMGKTPAGEPIQGDYKFTEEFPMVEGFAENAEFLTLTYEAPLNVSANHGFASIAPLLWLRAGSRGRRIDTLPKGWDVADAYGVIDRLDRLDDFLTALTAQPTAKVAFIVTDDDRRFQAALAQLPDGVEPVRLYESYLRNFQIDAVRSSR